MVDILEKNGAGLNLTQEVRDGILNHQMNTMPFTLEGQIVRLSDKIAYIHHDMDDAIRGGILTDDDVPDEISSVVGSTLGQRLDRFIHDIITSSEGKAVITMSAEVEQAFLKMRAFMFERVYTNPVAKSEEFKAEKMIEALYEYFMEHPGSYVHLQRKGANYFGLCPFHNEEKTPSFSCVGDQTDLLLFRVRRGRKRGDLPHEI